MIPSVPDSVTKRVTAAGGLAPNGQPLFRIMRGCDRFTWIGGEWKKHDNSGNQIGAEVDEKLTIKYCGSEEKYILEMWCPPENYGSPEEWEENFTKCINGQFIRVLGPYPHNGEYELVKVIETPKGHYVPLTNTIVEAIVSVAVQNKHLPKQIRMEAFRDAQRRQEEANIRKRADMIENLERPVWARVPHIIIPSEYESIIKKERN